MDKPGPLDAALTYTVPDGRRSPRPLYFRGGNTTDELVTVVLMRDGVPMRYFPIGAKGDVHVPLRVVEDLDGGTVVELHLAAPRRAHRHGRRRPRAGGGLMMAARATDRDRGRCPDGKRRLVVIGNGMAGARAVEEILARGGAEQFQITMFGDEPYGNYNRIMLSQRAGRRGATRPTSSSTPATGTPRTTSPCTPACGSTGSTGSPSWSTPTTAPITPVRRADHRHRQPVVHPADGRACATDDGDAAAGRLRASAPSTTRAAMIDYASATHARRW